MPQTHERERRSPGLDGASQSQRRSSAGDRIRPQFYALSDNPSPSSSTALMTGSPSASTSPTSSSPSGYPRHSPTGSSVSGTSSSRRAGVIMHHGPSPTTSSPAPSVASSSSSLSSSSAGIQMRQVRETGPPQQQQQPFSIQSTNVIRSGPSAATLHGAPRSSSSRDSTPVAAAGEGVAKVFAGGSKSLRHDGKLGTLRTMSMRGKRPTRIVKKRVVSKSDPKSYFSAERTMYSWMYAATVVLSVSLTLYSYVSVEADLSVVGLQIGTVLSALSLVIFFYATFHFFWRRHALRRVADATAFDDRLGPIVLTFLIIVALLVNMILAWVDPVAGVKVGGGKSFVPGHKPTAGATIAALRSS